MSQNYNLQSPDGSSPEHTPPSQPVTPRPSPDIWRLDESAREHLLSVFGNLERIAPIFQLSDLEHYSYVFCHEEEHPIAAWIKHELGFRMYAAMTLFRSTANDVASWSPAVKTWIEDSFYELPADVTIALSGLFCVLRSQDDDFPVLQLMSFLCRVRSFLNDLIDLQSSQDGAATTLSKSKTLQLVRAGFDTKGFRELSRELGLGDGGHLQQDLQSAWDAAGSLAAELQALVSTSAGLTNNNGLASLDTEATEALLLRPWVPMNSSPSLFSCQHSSTTLDPHVHFVRPQRS